MLNKVQQSALFQRMVTEYGEPETWPQTVLQEATNLIDSLSVTDLKNITQSNLITLLERAQDAEWSQDQVSVIIFVIEALCF